MATSLSRFAVEEQIAAHIAGKLSAQTLAAWAFEQSCDEEEEQISFEQGYEDAIADVLDDLMWVDDRTFSIDAEAAQKLVARLQERTQEGESASDDADSEEW